MKFSSPSTSTSGRSKIMKGVSVLALFALVGVGYNLRPEVDSESMRLKTDFELEALSDPLVEDLAQDLHRRVLSDYRDAKGLFSCNEDCQVRV
jgi:hypothetical protein